jgi:WD40 repeat protein
LDIETQKPVLGLRNSVTTIPPTLGLAISDDGRFVATAYAGDRVLIWDIVGRRAIADFSAEYATTILRFSADGGRLLAVGFAMGVFDIAAGKFTSADLRPRDIDIGDPFDARFGADGASIVAIADNYFAIWTLGKATPSLVKTGLGAGGGAVSPDGTKIAAVSTSQVSVWDVRTKQETDTWRLVNPSDSAAFLGESQRLAVGGSTNDIDRPIRTVEVYDLPGGRLVTQYQGAGEGLVDRITYHPSGLILAASQGEHEYPEHALDVFVAPG